MGHVTQLIQLIRAEWLKLSRRPLTWILLGVFLLLQLASGLVWFLVVALHDGVLLDTDLTRQIFAQLAFDEEIAQFRLELQFPGVFGSVLGQFNGIGGVLAMILAAGVMGGEYTWGTLRVQLARQPRRWRYLLAKIITLLLALLTALVIALLIGCGLAFIAGSILGDVGQVRPLDGLLLLLGMVRALYVVLPYLLFTIAISIIGRSVLAGVAGSLIFLAVDGGSGTFAFLTQLGNPLITFLYNLILQPNINALAALHRSSYGMDASVITGLDTSNLPPTWHAVVVVAVYCGLFGAYAFYAFTRRDVGGAT